MQFKKWSPMFKARAPDSVPSSGCPARNHSCLSATFDEWVDLTDALTVQLERLARGDSSARHEAVRLVLALKDQESQRLGIEII